MQLHSVSFAFDMCILKTDAYRTQTQTQTQKHKQVERLSEWNEKPYAKTLW